MQQQQSLIDIINTVASAYDALKAVSDHPLMADLAGAIETLERAVFPQNPNRLRSIPTAGWREQSLIDIIKNVGNAYDSLQASHHPLMVDLAGAIETLERTVGIAPSC